MRIIFDQKLDFHNVLIVPKRSTLSSRKEVDLFRTFSFVHSNRKMSCIPIIASNMDTTGTLLMASVFKKYNALVALHKFIPLEKLISFYNNIENEDQNNVFLTIGLDEYSIEKYKKIKNSVDRDKVNKVCIDVANGYTEKFINFVSQFRMENPNVILMAGNVVTPEITEQLILKGADIIKVGIGSGSCCTTRKLTGVGYPQLSAIIECADAAHGLKGHICSDGGIEVIGDISKAFGGGADFVMMGSMFAGHDECDNSEIIEKEFLTNELDENGNLKKEKKKMMKFYGMSSSVAIEKYFGGLKDYRSVEGKEVLVEYKGSVENTIKEILGGLRSACTYVGASKIKELSKRTTFVLVSKQLNEKYK